MNLKGNDFSTSFGKTLQSLQSQSSQTTQAPQTTRDSRQLIAASRSESAPRGGRSDPSTRFSSKSDESTAAADTGTAASQPKDATQKPKCAPEAKADETTGTDVTQDAGTVADPTGAALALLVPQPLTQASSAAQTTVTSTQGNLATQPTAAVPSQIVVQPNPVAVTPDVTASPVKATLNPPVSPLPVATENAPGAAPKATAEALVNQTTPSAITALPSADQSDLTSASTTDEISRAAFSSSGQLANLASPITTSSATAPAVSVHAAAEAVAVEAARVAPGGKSEIVLRLDPPDLGSIKVQIQHDPNGLRIDVFPQKVHAAELLQSQVDSLKNRLENAGFGNVQVQIRQDQGPASQHQNQRQDHWEDVSPDSFSAGLKKAGSPWKATALPGVRAMALTPSVDFMA